MSEYQRQLKQKYLRENILQKQYDAEQFMDFCQNYKGSVDIDSWTLNQLKDIVKRFIQQQDHKKQQDAFQQYQSTQSPTKNDMFDNFSSFIDSAPKIQQKKPSFQLNLVDLDFLDAMGMGGLKQPIKKQPVPIIIPNISNNNINNTKKIQSYSNSNIPVKKNNPNPNEQLMKKIQNQDFISVYSKPQVQKKNSQNIHTSISTQSNVKKVQNNNKAINQVVPKMPAVIIPSTRSDKQIGQTYESFVEQLKCRQLTKNKIQQNLICTITGHQIINPNVFVPKFVLYTITSTPVNISVKRRLKDFQQLRSLLQKMFPTSQIPHLQRYSRLSQTQGHVISKQKLYLQSFINSLLMNPLLRCKILEQFLFCTDLDLIKKIFREWQKIQKPKSLEQMWAVNGKIKLDTNTANRKYMNQQLLYVDYVQNSFVKLKTLYDQLITFYQNTSKVISEISQVYDQLKQTTKNMNQQFQQNLRLNTFSPIIGAVSLIHKQMSDALQTQAKIINTELKHIFKYQSQNFQTIKQTLKTLNTIHDVYQKRSDKESAKKQAYQSKKLNQFKIGAQVPSKNITVLKYQSAYAQNQFKEQIYRYMDELAKKIGTKFQIFSTLQVSIAGDMDLVWRQFQQFVQKYKK